MFVALRLTTESATHLGLLKRKEATSRQPLSSILNELSLVEDVFERLYDDSSCEWFLDDVVRSSRIRLGLELI